MGLVVKVGNSQTIIASSDGPHCRRTRRQTHRPNEYRVRRVQDVDHVDPRTASYIHDVGHYPRGRRRGDLNRSELDEVCRYRDVVKDNAITLDMHEKVALTR